MLYPWDRHRRLRKIQMWRPEIQTMRRADGYSQGIYPGSLDRLYDGGIIQRLLLSHQTPQCSLNANSIVAEKAYDPGHRRDILFKGKNERCRSSPNERPRVPLPQYRSATRDDPNAAPATDRGAPPPDNTASPGYRCQRSRKFRHRRQNHRRCQLGGGLHHRQYRLRRLWILNGGTAYPLHWADTTSPDGVSGTSSLLHLKYHRYRPRRRAVRRTVPHAIGWSSHAVRSTVPARETPLHQTPHAPAPFFCHHLLLVSARSS